MDATTARQEAEKILAELPDRISDVIKIKPFSHHSPDRPALVQGDVAWTYAELAAVVADTALILELYDVRPGDRVMIVSENSLALVALILAISELDAWSVVVKRHLSERHDADIAVLRGLGTLGVGPLNRETAPLWMRCRRPRPARSSSTAWPTRVATGSLDEYRRLAWSTGMLRLR